MILVVKIPLVIRGETAGAILVIHNDIYMEWVLGRVSGCGLFAFLFYRREKVSARYRRAAYLHHIDRVWDDLDMEVSLAFG